jgi:hypothetical protein
MGYRLFVQTEKSSYDANVKLPPGGWCVMGAQQGFTSLCPPAIRVSQAGEMMNENNVAVRSVLPDGSVGAPVRSTGSLATGMFPSVLYIPQSQYNCFLRQ